jgi:hypothetical protein
VPEGMIVLTGCAVLVAALMHWRIGRFWVASLFSGFATFILFFMICFLFERLPAQRGIAPLVLISGYGYLVAVIVGLLRKGISWGWRRASAP